MIQPFLSAPQIAIKRTRVNEEPGQTDILVGGSDVAYPTQSSGATHLPFKLRRETSSPASRFQPPTPAGGFEI